jgi:hypothetical protein
MKARRLLESASSYSPETLSGIFQAFDAAWAEMAHQFHTAEEIENARLRLAHAILLVAPDDDPQALKESAVQVMTLALRRRAAL